MMTKAERKERAVERKIKREQFFGYAKCSALPPKPAQRRRKK